MYIRQNFEGSFSVYNMQDEHSRAYFPIKTKTKIMAVTNKTLMQSTSLNLIFGILGFG